MVTVYRSEVIAERRRYPRKPLNLKVKFELIDTSASPGAPPTYEINNISAGGLALYSEHKLQKGQELSLVLYLPPKDKRSPKLALATWSENDSIPIHIHAQITWCLSYSKNHYGYGVEFLEVDADDQPDFDEFLKDFYLHKPSVINE